jgi:hypothetical protein
MCECKNVMLYLTSYTIGTYRYSSKSVALRLLIKQLCWVGAVLITIKPRNNIDDGSTTFKVIDHANMINDNKEFYC